MNIVERRKAAYQPASEYIKHCYKIPNNIPTLPLGDEPFTALWRKKYSACGLHRQGEIRGRRVLELLADGFGLDPYGFAWQNADGLSLGITETLAGGIPVISTESHGDFCNMEALVNGRREASDLPPTVNAFTIVARAGSIFRHRIILLNYAPYSNIPASFLGLSREEWLARSHRLRLRHECAHYEMLRLFGDMENHALDEIAADAMGQIAAFGNVDADRQRLFFGLTRGGDICKGRLSFYCGTVLPEERRDIYRAVDRVLDSIADEVNRLLGTGASEFEILKSLAGRSIADRLTEQSVLQNPV